MNKSLTKTVFLVMLGSISFPIFSSGTAIGTSVILNSLSNLTFAIIILLTSACLIQFLFSITKILSNKDIPSRNKKIINTIIAVATYISIIWFLSLANNHLIFQYPESFSERQHDINQLSTFIINIFIPFGIILSINAMFKFIQNYFNNNQEFKSILINIFNFLLKLFVSIFLIFLSQSVYLDYISRFIEILL